MGSMFAPSSTGPQDISLLHALGAFHFAFGRPDTALNLLELARFLDERNRDTHIMLARMYFDTGDLDAAVERLDFACAISDDALDPNDVAFERRLRLMYDIAPPSGLTRSARLPR